MLCKESFLLLIPALIVSYLGINKIISNDSNWLTVIKNNIIDISIILSLFCISIYFVLTKVNTEALGYAGIHGVSFKMYIETFYKLFSEGGIGIVSTVIFCISFISIQFIPNKKTRMTKIHLFVLVITILIILPQVYLYGKSGIFERYFLPGMIGWAIMLSFSLRNIQQFIQIKFSTKYKNIFLLNNNNKNENFKTHTKTTNNIYINIQIVPLA